MIASVWSKMEKKPSVRNRLSKLYPFSYKDAKQWDTLSVVDTALAQLDRRSTLPVEDATSFRDPMERMDSELKKAYTVSGLALKPAITLSSLSRAFRFWISSIKVALKIIDLGELKLGSDFMAEASLDLIRLTARSIALSVSVRHALWLRLWQADTTPSTTYVFFPSWVRSFSEKSWMMSLRRCSA